MSVIVAQVMHRNRSYVHNRGMGISKRSLNEHQSHGNRRNFTWNIMTRNGCNLKIKDMVQINENDPFPSSFSLLSAKRGERSSERLAGLPLTPLACSDVSDSITKKS